MRVGVWIVESVRKGMANPEWISLAKLENGFMPGSWIRDTASDRFSILQWVDSDSRVRWLVTRVDLTGTYWQSSHDNFLAATMAIRFMAGDEVDYEISIDEYRRDRCI